VERKKRIIIALIIAVVIVLAAFYLAKRSAQKLDQARGEGLAHIQTALDEDKDCAAVLPEIKAYLGKRPADIDVWHAKGICEFESGKYEEAKQSFERVLALEPDNGAAKNYLSLLNEEGVSRNVSRDGLSQGQFEEVLGFGLPAAFEFQNAKSFPIEEQLKSVSGDYTTALAGGQAVAALKNFLAKSDLAYIVREGGSEDVVVYDINSAGKIVSVFINTSAQPVRIAIGTTVAR